MTSFSRGVAAIFAGIFLRPFLLSQAHRGQDRKRGGQRGKGGGVQGKAE